MKITIKAVASDPTRTIECDLEDMGVTEEEWDNHNDDAKQEALQDYLNNLHEQPYWTVDKFHEEKD